MHNWVCIAGVGAWDCITFGYNRVVSGVSQSPCTIRPLIAALSFHQFFEGFALGGCISQAQFKASSATIMACFFALTTPLGVSIGTAISSGYNPYQPRCTHHRRYSRFLVVGDFGLHGFGRFDSCGFS
ncbi:hypothetical protein ACSQ67_018587 [Phaseolus vulgaris]